MGKEGALPPEIHRKTFNDFFGTEKAEELLSGRQWPAAGEPHRSVASSGDAQPGAGEIVPVTATAFQQEGQQLASRASTPHGQALITGLYEHSQQVIGRVSEDTQARLARMGGAGRKDKYTDAIEGITSDTIAAVQSTTHMGSEKILGHDTAINKLDRSSR